MIELEVGPAVHGGHCVARVDGRVVFVRHALPGERVLAEVTEERKDYLRADALTVLRASPDRVEPPCPYARPGLCGGCDFQHASLPAQRELKAGVVREQLRRLAGLDVEVTVEELAPTEGWRSRVQYTAGEDGRLGFHRHRSRDVVPVDHCVIAHPELQPSGTWPAGTSVELVASSTGDRTVLQRADRADRRTTVVEGPERVTETVHGRRWSVPAAGFWQVHPRAAESFAAAVHEMTGPTTADRVWDLYGGAGLFAAALAPEAGPVTVVEGDRRAVLAGRKALADLTNVRFAHGDVAEVLRNPRWRSVDVVVLDPPRAGAGREVVTAITRRRPRAVAYVACDPAALGRDTKTFLDQGYRLAALRAFDAFPHTHHVECIALLLAV